MADNDKLIEARKEIEAVLKKHDIAGYVALHMPGYLETFSQYDPSYSLIKPILDDGGDMIGLHIKGQEQDKLTNTSNLLSGLAQVLAMEAMNLIQVSKALDKELGAEHTELEKIAKSTGNDIPRT